MKLNLFRHCCWLVFAFASISAVAEIRLIVQPVYLPPSPVLVRVELVDSNGMVRRSVWDSEATLDVEAPSTLSTNRLLLRNGVGSTLVGINSTTNVLLTVRVGNETTTKELFNGANVPLQLTGGTLTGTNTTWSGIVRLTNDVIVPANHLLTISPGTMILLDGLTSTTNGTDLHVNGAVEANGTEAEPIVFTARQTNSSWNLNWGQLRHIGAQTSRYDYVHFSKAGRTRGEGHTGTGPMVRGNNSVINFKYCAFGDNTGANGATIGKVMMATGCELVMDHCLLTRSRMGPEIDGTSLLCTNTYILDMSGPDDSDGIYLHGQRTGQQLLLTGCVVAYGEDDGIDTLSSTVTVTNCIVRNFSREEDSKGISIFSQRVNIHSTIVTDCSVGVSAKGFANTPLAVYIDRSTIVVTNQAFGVTNKSSVTPVVSVFITNSILVAEDAIFTDYDTNDILIGYSIASEPWEGVGNLTADPLFVDEPGHDFRLQNISPAIDAGDPGSWLDVDGTRADIGALPSLALPAPLAISLEASNALELRLEPGRGTMTIQSSTNLVDWSDLTTLTNSTTGAVWTPPQTDLQQYYRARLGP